MTIEDQKDSAATHTVEKIDADENEFSDLGASIDTDLTSLSSSVRDHVYENGRRYHSLNAGTYVLPNDETEQERLDIGHHCTGLMLEGELQLVKLPEHLNRVLDVGTGTGIWAIDFADAHPEATVIGVDLSPIQPSWVPPNCVFEVDDITKPWMWKEPFDYIHSANIAQGIKDWPEYLKRMYDNLTPGGVIQLYEAQIELSTDDDTIPKGGYIERYQENIDKAQQLAGILVPSKNLGSYVRDAGFDAVGVVLKKVPLGPWPKDPKKKLLGKWGLAVIEHGLKAYGMALFTRQLGLSTEEATKICDGAFDELCSRKVHCYVPQWFIEGRKPQDAAGQ